jgi:amino acid transporter
MIVGFEMMTVVAGETRDPERNIPRALFTVVLTSGALLLALFIVLVGVYPQAALSEKPVADAALAIMGPAGRIIALGILLSVIGVNLSCALATPRYLYTMSRDGYLPRLFARVSATGHVPHIAVLVSFAITYGLTIGNGYVHLAVLAAIARIGQYMMSCIALLILRGRKRPEDISYRAPAGHLMAITALVICGWLLASAQREHLLWSLLALCIGYCLFFANRMFNRTDPGEAEHGD